MVGVADRKLQCEACGEPFVYAEAEWTEDERLGLPAPRVCSSCHQKRRAARAAERAAKRPRRGRFRR